MQQLIAPAAPVVHAVPAVPVSPGGQLGALRDHLVRCQGLLEGARRRAGAAMVDADLEERERWDAVRGLRVMAWKIRREILPLPTRVPRGLQSGPAWDDCMRAAHALRRQVDDAMREHANLAVDLVAATGAPAA